MRRRGNKMARPENVINLKFGRLTVISIRAAVAGSNRKANCRCDCGTVKDVRIDHLKDGQTVSCGCFIREKLPRINRTHGESRSANQTAEYRCWAGLISRCFNSTVRNYQRYGG